ncbi:MAG: right-handed parallel beta-helix repeat-containing protein [Planctomycetes bacterium]|nr:right-handed parallel beta-helix repeat-containing protein [Planctomycetota bacterium]
MLRSTSLLAAVFVCLCAGVAHATDYYVSPTGDNGASGGPGDPFQTITHALGEVAPGDTVVVKDGTYNEWVYTQVAGTETDRITLRAENPGAATVLNITSQSWAPFIIGHPNYTVEGLIMDGNWGGKLVRVFGPGKEVPELGMTFPGGDNLIFRDNIVRNTTDNGVDLGTPQNVLIDNCHIYNCLKGSKTSRGDAHGIATGGVKNFTIRNTEVNYVSGDALQTQDGFWENVIVEGCTFWNGPLPAPTGGFSAGVNPGENAIDTKEDSSSRATMIVRDSTFYGWRGIIDNASALNLKERCEVLVENCTLCDNEIALRVRGRSSDGGAHVTVRNSVFYENDWPIRYEDDVQQFEVHNNTFDEGEWPVDGQSSWEAESLFRSPGYDPLESPFLNNLFIFTDSVLPPECSDPSNMFVGPEDFVNAAAHDYHLLAGSAAVDAGADLTAEGVLFDFDGVPRPQGDGYDVGAYELPEPTTLVLLAVAAPMLLRRRRKV